MQTNVLRPDWRENVRFYAKKLKYEKWFAGHVFAKARGSEVGTIIGRDRICAEMEENEAEYIANFDPITVLAMLDYIEELEKIIDQVGNDNAKE